MGLTFELILLLQWVLAIVSSKLTMAFDEIECQIKLLKLLHFIFLAAYQLFSAAAGLFDKSLTLFIYNSQPSTT